MSVGSGMVSDRPLRPAAHYVGRWLRSASRQHLGLGYCKQARDGQLVLSYIDVPDVAEHEVLVPRQDVIDRPIPEGTRVWVRGRPYGWHAGVIDRATTARRYHVSLVGVTKQLLLYEDQFVLRWARPLENPVLAVSHGLTEAPTFYEARSRLLAQLTEQRRVSRGLAAAVSAPIRLFQHQLDTAARVLSDPAMRYLLADEVGLGKTIEAGIVIRQLLLDDPRSNILVLCPSSLRGQWIAELRDRLGLSEALQSTQLAVFPHTSVSSLAVRWAEGLRHYDLIVLDEAHRLLEEIGIDSKLERELGRVDGLMALSATPLRGDVDTFRRLLALVDPVAFGDTTTDDFKARLDERERSAADVQLLTARRASLRQKSAVLNGLIAEFPNDENIRALAAACLESGDPHAPAWSDLADYIREVYRLSRRMIRHRRTSELTDSYVVAGRFPTFIEVQDPARKVVDEFLESYRLRLLGSSSTTAFARAVLHGLAGPIALWDYLKRPPSPAERPLFDMAVARLEMAGMDHRLQVAAEVVAERVGKRRRVVVVSSFANVLERFEALLKGVVDGYRVHRHYASMAPAAQDAAVARFLASYWGAVLLADTSMEEGRNLQVAEVLVNLDLPLDANRLDQRIGRLDRYAVRPDPAEVVVLTEPSSEWVTAHIDLLHAGIGVFTESVSTVQRLLGTVLDGIVHSLLENGVEALQLDSTSLRDELEAERNSIDLLEELESVEASTVFDRSAFEDLVEYETDVEPLRSAMRRLTTGTGSLDLRPKESPDGVVRFGSARGIGLSGDEARALERILKPKAYSRDVSVGDTGISPFRVGDPLVDWLQEYLFADERGRASAWARPVPGLATPALWLHCEFLVQFDAEAYQGSREAIQRRLSRRGEAHLQPMRFETWTDPSGPAPSSLVEEVLGMPFDRRRDEVVRGPIWGPVLEAFPTWQRLCAESAEAAWDELQESEVLSLALDLALASAETDAARRLAVLKARALRLPTGPERLAAKQELGLENETAEAVAAGIRNPSIRLVAAGACILWPEDNF